MNSSDPIINETVFWHGIQVDEVLNRLTSSSESGLSQASVKALQKKYGLNELPKRSTDLFVVVFLRQFKSPLIYLLLIAVGIAFGIGSYVDAQVILIVLLGNALIGSLQERRAQISMETLRNMTRVTVKVLRDNKESFIDSKELVPGDILILNEGDAVGADARLISTSSLQVSEASLTGESMPIWKIIAVLPTGTTLADRTNMVFAGTHVTKGRGTAVVIATGALTEIGEVAALTEATEKLSTPLEKQIAEFSKHVVFVSIFVFISIVLIGMAQQLSFTMIFMIALSEVVSLVPEGLPVAMTVALAIGMERMARRGAIVRKLDAVETLGSINVICTDKTGTLTRNEMTVTEIFLSPKRNIKVTQTRDSFSGEFLERSQALVPPKDPHLMEFLTAAVLCNDAKVVANSDGPGWSEMGDPTEVSLLRLAIKGDCFPDRIRGRFSRVEEIPFSPETKMMAVRVEEGGEKKIYIKGAPEFVLELCSTVRIAKMNIPVDSAIIEPLHLTELSMAGHALRILAFAVIDDSKVGLTNGWEALKGQACFLGLSGQFDPPRPEVKLAVQSCRQAGIRPVIITGDHKVTGLAIAKMIDIAEEGDIVIDGNELSLMSDRDLKTQLPHITVFARVHPAQKLRIVKAWQEINAVVAMTGDGVNDAPALVKANVGVAMGITGTEVAKEAAKIIVTDDNFATIVHAIEEGRIVSRNLKKLLLYLVSTGIAELAVLYAALILGFPMPLAAVQILWINLITDGVLSFPLILEPSEGDEMKHAPFSRNEPLINRKLIKRMAFMIPAMAASTFFYFIYRLDSGMSFAQVQTGTFTVLVVCQWFNAFNCQSERRSVFQGLLKNRWLLAGLLLGNLLQMCVVFLPPLNRLFHTEPIPLSEVFFIGLVASLVLWVEELRKLWIRSSSTTSQLK